MEIPMGRGRAETATAAQGYGGLRPRAERGSGKRRARRQIRFRLTTASPAGRQGAEPTGQIGVGGTKPASAPSVLHTGHA